VTGTIRLRVGAPIVEVVRSGSVENVHSGHFIALAADGSVIASLGDPGQPVFPRSCVKPLQATGMVSLGLTGPREWLALAAASHSGQPRHRIVVQQMLASAGLDERDLACPAAVPVDAAASAEWVRAGLTPSRLAMNCSGKHAAMLLTCRARGWPTAGYLAADHPLQVALRATVEELTGEKVAAIGVDGCGAPLFAISLTGLARSFTQVATAEAGTAAHAVVTAMRAHPDLVAGTGRPATALMAGIPGLIAKDGAEGGFAAALADGRTVAVKIDDGAQRAADRAVVAGLRLLGVSAAVLDEWAELPVLGGGVPVGSVRVVPALRFDAST
jgi:L-asparaginase II